MARPTKYSNKLICIANDYLEDWGDSVIPTIEGLSERLNIARSTLYLWGNQGEKKEFSDILERLKAKQAKILIDKGLTGEFNPTLTKLMLTKHGYSDKISQEFNVQESHEEWLDKLN